MMMMSYLLIVLLSCSFSSRWERNIFVGSFMISSRVQNTISRKCFKNTVSEAHAQNRFKLVLNYWKYMIIMITDY